MNGNPRAISLTALFAILIGLLCNAVTQTFNMPLQAQTGVETMELQPALELIIKLLNDITFVAAAAPLVVALTAAFKRYIPTQISAATIAIIMQVLVWVGWVLAKHFGYEAQFGDWTNAFTTIISAIMGLTVSAFAATKIYKEAHDRRVPWFGSDKRPASG